MNRCLRVSFSGNMPQKVVELLAKSAQEFSIEGTVQVVDGISIQVVVCGSQENCDHFLDVIHKAVSSGEFKDLEVEPFLKTKDYRGVFRVID